MKKVQLYIPSLLEFVNAPNTLRFEEVEMVGIKTPNIKYFVAHPSKQEVRMEQIVSEDFILYDIKLDFAAKTLSFFLESDEASLSPMVLQKAYQAFAVKYSPDKFGFLVYASGGKRRKKQA